MKEQQVKIPESDVERILIVEDETAIGTLCRRVLAGEGFEVDITINGKTVQGMMEKQ